MIEFDLPENQRLIKDVFTCKWAILQLCGRGMWDLRVKSSDIAIPLQPLKVGKEGSDLYLLSLKTRLNIFA